MKKALFLSLAAAYLICCLFTATAQQICSSEVGTNGGYSYEMWTEGTGTACMTLGSGGTYSVSWQNAGNFVARKGLRPGGPNVTCTYTVNYNPNGNSYLAIYGWTRNPLIEFYIVDGWGNWRPPGSTSKGTITADGATYDIYETTRTNQPSIDGTATFQQFWSVRTSSRTSGTINCAQHFAAWANNGMNIGSSFYEVSFAIEGYQSSGTANVTSMTMTQGGTSTPDPTNPPTVTATPAPTTPGVTNPPAATNPPAVTNPPTATNPPATGCTCPNLCSSQTSISVPFTKDGAGEFCYTSSSLANYVNCWNLDSCNINGVNCTNTYKASSSIPAIGGMYYIYYKGSYAWSHLEIK